MKDTRLARQHSFQLKYVCYLDHICLFLGFYEDIQVALKEQKRKYPIFHCGIWGC